MNEHINYSESKKSSTATGINHQKLDKLLGADEYKMMPPGIIAIKV